MNARAPLAVPVALLAVVALLVAGCTSSNVDARTKAIRDTGKISLKHACSPSTCAGTRAGARFTVELPDTKQWNGTLVIWSHGYRPASPVPTNPLDPTTTPASVDRNAEAAPSKAVAAELIKQGYALTGSAFASNGWDVLDGVKADEDLYSYFSNAFGKPKRVYVWGDSLGGLITETLAEKHPAWISGVAPMCGVLGGTNRNLDLALDVAYAVKTLVFPQLKVTGFASVDEAVAQWEAASKALVRAATAGTGPDIANLFAIAALSGAPTKTDLFDGSTLVSQISALLQGVLVALGYGTYGRYDIEQRVGGNPSQNTSVDYGKRIGTTYAALIGAERTRIVNALNNGTKITADAGARSKADQLGNPSGAIQRPTITLHTENDPLVLVQNENLFAAQVARNAGRGQLVQLFTAAPGSYSAAPYGAGHCNFTTSEYTGVISLLDKWVTRGVYPGPLGVADALNYTVDNTATGKNTPALVAAGKAKTGYDPNYAAPPWPGQAG